MEYILREDESSRDFVHRALQGRIDSEGIQLFVFVLEMIITEISHSTYYITFSYDEEDIVLTVRHSGSAIKKNIIVIIDDQVDYLRYNHTRKDLHILKIKHKH